MSGECINLCIYNIASYRLFQFSSTVYIPRFRAAAWDSFHKYLIVSCLIPSSQSAYNDRFIISTSRFACQSYAWKSGILRQIIHLHVSYVITWNKIYILMFTHLSKWVSTTPRSMKKSTHIKKLLFLGKVLARASIFHVRLMGAAAAFFHRPGHKIHRM
jgi:hypothetical protein